MHQREQVFRNVWHRIEEQYGTGYIVSERALQATLFAELAHSLKKVDIIAEPVWEVNDRRMIPDIVIVEENRITDIFELKYVPHHYPKLQEDLRKLVGYSVVLNQNYPVQINPADGKWRESIPVHNSCRLHFVAVGRHDAAAVWSDSLKAEVPELANYPGKLNHWYGRIGGNSENDVHELNWNINFGI